MKEGKLDAVSIGMGEDCISNLEKIDFENYQFVINAGVCGSVNPDYNLFDIVSPLKVADEGKFHTAIPLNRVKDFKDKLKECGIKTEGSLLTVKNPVFKREEKENLFSRGTDFIDMECFYIAKHFPNLIPVKVITDTVYTESKKENHFENITEGLEKLKNKVAEFLRKSK